jgi:hypothetical protein
MYILNLKIQSWLVQHKIKESGWTYNNDDKNTALSRVYSHLPGVTIILSIQPVFFVQTTSLVPLERGRQTESSSKEYVVSIFLVN